MSEIAESEHVLYGQMFSHPKQISDEADYFQVDISGIDKNEFIEKYTGLPEGSSIILSADWEKNTTPNSIYTDERQQEYVELVDYCNQYYNVLMLQLHPPTGGKKRQERMNQFNEVLESLLNYVDAPVSVENRSSSKFLCSNPDEIAALTDNVYITIDIPQYLIGNNFNYEELNQVLESNSDKIIELHCGDIMEKKGRRYVAQPINTGIIDWDKVDFDTASNVNYRTIEVLGGKNRFENSKHILEEK